MKKVIIVHGFKGNPNKNWFPWLKAELEKQDIAAVVPQMPHPNTPQLDEWLPYLQQIVGNPSSEIFLVGHSLGCITILRYLEALPEGTTIGGALLVAGFAEPIHLDQLNNFFETELNAEKIQKSAKRIVCINSNNDEHVPLWQAEKMKDRFNATLLVLNNAGHINEMSGFTECRPVLEELTKMMN